MEVVKRRKIRDELGLTARCRQIYDCISDKTFEDADTIISRVNSSTQYLVKGKRKIVRPLTKRIFFSAIYVIKKTNLIERDTSSPYHPRYKRKLIAGNPKESAG